MEKEQEAVKDKKKMDIVSANPLYKYVKGVFTLIGKDGNSTLKKLKGVTGIFK